jgi:hypothetical protein
MIKSGKRLRFLITGIALLIIALSSCAATHKHLISIKKKEALCDLSRLGKNKYFYSSSYQRKMNLSSRAIRTK